MPEIYNVTDKPHVLNLNEIARQVADNTVYRGYGFGRIAKKGDIKDSGLSQNQKREDLKANLQMAMTRTLEEKGVDQEKYGDLFTRLLDQHINVEKHTKNPFRKDKFRANTGTHIKALSSEVDKLIMALQKAKEGFQPNEKQRKLQINDVLELTEGNPELKTYSLAAIQYGFFTPKLLGMLKKMRSEKFKVLNDPIVREFKKSIKERISAELQTDKYGAVHESVADEVAKVICEKARVVNQEELESLRNIDKLIRELRKDIRSLNSNFDDVRKDKLEQRAQAFLPAIHQIEKSTTLSADKKLKLLQATKQQINKIKQLHARSEELPEVGNLSINKMISMDEAFKCLEKYADTCRESFDELRANDLLTDDIASIIIDMGQHRPQDVAKTYDKLLNALNKIQNCQMIIECVKDDLKPFLEASAKALPHLKEMAEVAREIMDYNDIFREFVAINKDAGVAMEQQVNLKHDNSSELDEEPASDSSKPPEPPQHKVVIQNNANVDPQSQSQSHELRNNLSPQTS